MAWIKAQDIAYGRLTAPDLDLMEEFLTRFGMHKVERTSKALYMRGTDPSHHINVTQKGGPPLRGSRVLGREGGRPETIDRGSGPLRDRDDRRAGRRQAGAADRAE